MTDKAYQDSNQNNLDDFPGKKDDQNSEIENLSNVVSRSRTQAAIWNTTSEHHRNAALSSEDLGHKREHETAEPRSMKKLTIFSGTKQQQDTHFIIAETPSDKAESGTSNSLRASVIRHTRDEPLHISSPPENENAAPESINETEDHVQTNSSCITSEGAHVAGPSHFICGECNKCFLFKSQLDRHHVMHCRGKSFSCEICDQKFSLKGNLNRHMLTHSDQKLFKCDRCHKEYSRKDILTRHYRIHTGEKPYKCDKCGKRFSDASHSNKHRKKCGSSSKTN